jgi:type I restriction enzyme S subunit
MKNHSDKNTKQPKLRFPGFTGEWQEKRLGDVGEKIMYGMNSAAIDFDGMNKYLRITDIDDETRSFKPNPLTSPDGQIEDKYRLRKGDMVFTRTGASVGKSYLYKEKDGNLFFAGFLIKFSITKSDPYFIYAQTLRDQYSKWVQLMSMRSGQPGINAEEFKSMPIKITTLPEQKRIAEFLSEIDIKIEKLTRKKELTEQYKKGAMQKIFSQKIRFKDENGKNYPDWEEKKLGEVAEVLMGQSPPSDSYNESKDGIPLIQGNADIKNRVTFPKIYTSEPTKLCHTGDVLMTVRAPVGAIAKSEHEACIGRGVCAIRAKNKINSNFLYQFLITYEPQWKNLEQGSTFSAVNGKDIKGMEINMPCLEEQKKIVDFLIDLDTRIQHIDKELVTLKEFKKGLLQGMFV